MAEFTPVTGAQPVVPFGDRLRAAMDAHGQLCVGIDPHGFLLREWGLEDSPAGLLEFGLRVVDAASGVVPIVKPQVAFFERHGAAGYAALERVLAHARSAGLLVIADAKRGDVGTSVEAYGEAWLTPGSPLAADAMTVSAFQGVGSLAAVVHRARSTGSGLFVLAATSNPEGVDAQRAIIRAGQRQDRTVAGGIVDDVQQLDPSARALGSFGVVIGGTIDLDASGIAPSSLERVPVLAPGFGAQGATFADVRPRFGAASPNVLVSASRSVLAAGPEGIDAAVRDTASELASCLE